MDSTITKVMLIPTRCHGTRLDVVLAELFPEFSRSQLQTWLKAGQITVNQRPWKSKEKVSGGELIQLQVMPIQSDVQSRGEDIPLDIIFEDDSLIIVNKPAGLVVHPGAGNREHTLVNALLYHARSLHELPRAGIIHRLDKDTTGLLVVAKTVTAYTHLVRQMQAREIQRHYITLVHGHVISGGTISTYYGRHPHNRLKMAVRPNGREAITQYTVNKRYQTFSLLDVSLLTGRTHQIRVHMAHINHPVVGDPLYGSRARYPKSISPEFDHALKQFKRQALHACQLILTHPLSQELIEFKAPIPEDFQHLLTLLDKYCD